MKKLVLFAMLFILPLSSQALLEVRAGYGINTFDEEDFSGSELTNMAGFNLDVIFEPPIITDLGLGVRYESMGFDFETAGVTVAEASMNRVSALINYRIIDFIAYFGVIGTVGLTTEFETKALGTTTSYDEKLNYTIGVEGGMNIGIFSVGAELGKFFAKVEDTGTEVDLESMYAKILVGIDF